MEIGEEVIVKLKIAKIDEGKKMCFLEGWVAEEDIVPIQGLDEAIEEAQKEIIVERIPKNGGLDPMTSKEIIR